VATSGDHTLLEQHLLFIRLCASAWWRRRWTAAWTALTYSDGCQKNVKYVLYNMLLLTIYCRPSLLGRFEGRLCRTDGFVLDSRWHAYQRRLWW